MRFWWSALLLGGCAGAVAAPPARGPDALDRDVAAYATASCLVATGQPYLREQGHLWAGAVIQRGEEPIETWSRLSEAVKADVARTGVGQGKPDRPDGPPVLLPVLTCGEIVYAPAVRTAMARARAALARDYRRRAAEGW